MNVNCLNVHKSTNKTGYSYDTPKTNVIIITQNVYKNANGL